MRNAAGEPPRACAGTGRPSGRSGRPSGEAARAAAAAQIGPLNEREILIAGAIAYWCEGAKNKPYHAAPTESDFMNSDPDAHWLLPAVLETWRASRRDKLIYQV